MFPNTAFCVLLVVTIYVITLSFVAKAATDDSSLKFAAFNIKWLGRKSRSDSSFEYLARIVEQYDLVFIQEVIKEEGLQTLLDVIHGNGRRSDFVCDLSAPQGTVSTYKEHYAYCYSPSKVTIADKHQWARDFAYPPYAVRLKPTNAAFPEFGFIGAHLTITNTQKGRETYREMDKLVDVYNHLKEQWGLENFIFAGDFNAGCTYMTEEKWSRVRLYTERENKFTWFITNDARTNLGGKPCPYDRIVGAGNELVSLIGRYGIFKFDEEYHLTEDQAKEISDHYPVYAEICAPTTQRFTRSLDHGSCMLMDPAASGSSLLLSDLTLSCSMLVALHVLG